jgi:hypothetical protein
MITPPLSLAKTIVVPEQKDSESEIETPIIDETQKKATETLLDAAPWFD